MTTPNRYGDLFRPTPRPSRDQWDAAQSEQSFGEWLRRTRTPAGMDADEQDLAHKIEQRTAELNRAAEQAAERTRTHDADTQAPDR
jgi:hypothetical protein